MDVDLDRFDALVRAAEEGGNPTAALNSLERALALVRGQVLEDEPYRLGRQDEALRAFDRCQTALAEELGARAASVGADRAGPAGLTACLSGSRGCVCRR